jgi:predicted transcriptional regulator of viral defense system
MRAIDAYGELLRMEQAVVTTREAAARWGTASRATSHRLQALEEAGLIHRLRRGLWAVGPEVEPNALAHHLTAPYPAYVSLWSALYQHDMIEQIPRQVSVISLDRPRTIDTSLGVYVIHRVTPELFDGYTGSEESGYLALPEKAIFDLVYVRAASGSQAFFTELSLPPRVELSQMVEWTGRIKSSRLRTLVTRRLRQVLEEAQRGEVRAWV